MAKNLILLSKIVVSFVVGLNFCAMMLVLTNFYALDSFLKVLVLVHKNYHQTTPANTSNQTISSFHHRQVAGAIIHS